MLTGRTTRISVAAVGLALTPLAVAQASPIDLSAVADTYLRGGYAVNNNYGSDASLYVTSDTPTDSGHYRPVLKFDITGVGSQVDSATLTLTQSTIFDASTFEAFRGVGVSSQDWIESAASWNSYATGLSWATTGGGGDFTTDDAATASSSGINAPIVFDVTDMLQAAKDAGQGFLTVFIRGDAAGYNDRDSIISKEYSGYKAEDFVPRLTVSSESPSPEPASIALIGLGGALMLRRCRA